MGGPGPKVVAAKDPDVKANDAHDDARDDAHEQPGQGVARVTEMFKRGTPSVEQVADVVRNYPHEATLIANLLTTHPGIGSGFARKVFELAKEPKPPAKDRYISGDFGEEPTNTEYLHDKKVVEGGASIDSIQTKPNEALVLNKLRDDSRRFNPDFMLALQTRLGVSNKSGAFNTETLRKLLEQSPQLASVKLLANPQQAASAASLILANKGNWLAAPERDAKAPAGADAKPPIEAIAFTETGTAWGPEHGARSTTVGADPKENRADRVAHTLGYASYEAYHNSLHPSTTFLGQKLDGGNSSARAHPAVTGRLAIAEKWLRQRHPTIKDDKDLREKVGWFNGGNAAYGDRAEQIGENADKGVNFAVGVHMHSYGLAIDIDPGHNPYVLGDPQYWNANMEMHLRRAAQLFGGEAITSKKLEAWSRTLSSEELFAKVEKVSDSLHQYLDLPNTVQLDPELTEPTKDPKQKAAQHKAADDVKEKALAKVFAAKGYSPEQALRAGKDLLDFATEGREKQAELGAVWKRVGRQDSDKLTTHSQDLVVALRDVAGFAWGGTEMSTTENGDFMHFDLRNTQYGETVLTASQNKASKDLTDAAAADQLAAAKKSTTQP